MPRLQRNIPLLFWFTLTHRRHFISILSVYFMTLPFARAQQIGFYAAAGALTVFLTEIPSGYLSDRFGHKHVLILSKLFMLCSTLSFIFAESLWLFIAGSVFLNLSLAATSGTKDAFMHNTLSELGRGKEYTRIMSRISGNASLFSVLLSVSIPLLARIDLLWPLLTSIPFDVAGIIIAFCLASPKQRLANERIPFKKLKRSFQGMVKPGFWQLSLFVGVIGAFMIAESPFRAVFLESIGFPVFLLGLIMGFSRLVWFVVGRYAHLLEERFGVERLLRAEIVLLPLFFVLASVQRNPYVAGGLIATAVGYRWGRMQIVTNHFLEHYIKKEEYKATILSVKGQVQWVMQIAVAFTFGFIMEHGYRQGYRYFSAGLFTLMLLAWLLYKKR